MTANTVTDEQIGRFARRTRELQERVEKGVVPFDETMGGLQRLIEGKSLDIPAVHPSGSDDPYAAYRKVKGASFIGPFEWERAMTSRNRRNRNPLELNPGWCPNLPVTLDGKEFTLDHLKEVVRICQTSEWQTVPVLFLGLAEVAGTSTSLVGQYSWWGVQRDDFGPGSVRQDVFWSSWYCQRDDCPWRDDSAVLEPVWLLGYEHPNWTTRKTWDSQQVAVAERRMVHATAAQDVLMLNLVQAATGKRLRTATWSRVSTICQGCPLYVDSNGYGVGVSQFWGPEFAYDSMAWSVLGVPSELGF